MRSRTFADHKTSTFIPASRLPRDERLPLLVYLGMQLLDLYELVLHNQLRICAISAQHCKTLGELRDRSDRFAERFLCFDTVSINRLKLALLVLNHVLCFDPILNNRIEPGLARFEGAIAAFGLPFLRACPC